MVHHLTLHNKWHFGDEGVISIGFPTAWAHLSADLKPCDFLLWGFHKIYVYREIIQTIPELKASITRHVSSIYRETLHATVEHIITHFEPVTGANEMHISQIYD